MTAEEIQKNLLRVLSEAVSSRREARNNDTPFQGNKVAHSLAVDQLSRQVDSVHACCLAAGIPDETIRNIISLFSL